MKIRVHLIIVIATLMSLTMLVLTLMSAVTFADELARNRITLIRPSQKAKAAPVMYDARALPIPHPK